MRNLFAMAAAWFVVSCSTVGTAPGSIIVFENATVIDGISAAPLTGQSVRIEDERIAAVYASSTEKTPATARRIDLAGKTLLPGLINAHVHLTPNKDRVKALGAMLANGVTSIRDLGGNGALLSKLKESELPTPTLYFSATFFGPGFMDDPRTKMAAGGLPPGTAPWMRLIDAETDIAAAVADAKTSGASGLKLYASLDGETIASIVAEARAQDMKTWVHSVVFPAGPSDIVAAGPDQLIHTKGLAALGRSDIPPTFAKGVRKWTPALDFAAINPTSQAFDDLYAEMVQNGIILEPALIADGDIRVRKEPLALWQTNQRAWACQATKAAHEAGVMISAGTDYFGKPGLLFLEMERLTACGLTPMDSIQAATAINAHAIGIKRTRGTIAPGMIADILVVDGNPADDISDIRKTALVMLSGVIVRED